MAGSSTYERLSELLAEAPPDEVIALAERCLVGRGPTILSGPEVGMVLIGGHGGTPGWSSPVEVLATSCEVEHRGVRGRSVRPGDDAVASLAGAVLDSEVRAGGPLATEIVALLQRREAQATYAAAEP